MKPQDSIEEIIDDVSDLILIRTNPVLIIQSLIYEGFTPAKAETILRWAFHQAKNKQKNYFYEDDGILIEVDWSQYFERE